MLSVNLSWRWTQLASENLDEKSDQSKTTYIMSVTKLAQYTGPSQSCINNTVIKIQYINICTSLKIYINWLNQRHSGRRIWLQS